MSMLIRSGGAWHRAEPVSYEKETEFQELVKETFDLVLATQTDAPSIIAREVHTPLGGLVDVVAVDVDGVITLCECKLAKNAGARREVLGQVLEYAGGMNELSFHSFRTRMNARLDGDLVALLSTRAGGEFDEREWIALVSERLERGEFRLVVAVNQITDALKQTVQYLNDRAAFTILAVELQRAKHGDIEAIAPNVFGEEAALKKLAPPAKGTDVENADTVIVAATFAFAEFQATGAYVCQPNRSFRDGVEYLGFYAKRRIEPDFPRIIERRLEVPFTPAHANELDATGRTNDQQVAAIIRTLLANPDTYHRTEGDSYQVVLLDKTAGFALPTAVDHPVGSAWLRGQRYTRSDALKTQPQTTEQLAAAGG